MGILSAHAQQVSNRTQAAHLLSVGPKECRKHNFSVKKYYGEKYLLYGVDGRNLSLSKQNFTTVDI